MYVYPVLIQTVLKTHLRGIFHEKCELTPNYSVTSPFKIRNHRGASLNISPAVIKRRKLADRLNYDCAKHGGTAFFHRVCMADQ